MPKQIQTFDDATRKIAKLVGKPGATKRTQTGSVGDAGATGAQRFVNPMSTVGDLIQGGVTGAMKRLGIGTEDQVLVVVDVGGDLVPRWAAVPSGVTGITGSGEIAYGSPGTVGGNVALVSLGASATAISVFSTDTANKAIDANDTTNWSGDSSTSGDVPGDWIYIDLQTATEIAAWRLYQHDTFQRAATYKVQHSPDASTWTDIVTRTVLADDETVSFTSPVTDRYFRFLAVTGDTFGGSWKIRTIELYPVDVAVGTPTALTPGSTGDVLSLSGGVPLWTAPTALISAASDTVSGKVELATTAETTTGTDATRAVTPDGLHDMTSLAGAAWFIDEDSMASNLDTKTPSQQSVKAYVDAQVGGVGGVQPLLTWKSGTYRGSCSFPGLVGSAFNKSLTNDRLYAHPFLVPKSTSFDQIVVNINSSAAGNVHMGIYTMGTDGLPDALVVDAGVTSVATTGDKTASLSLTLAAGWYWIASLFSASPTAKAYNAPASPQSFLGNTTGPSEVSNFYNAVYRAFSYGSLPDPFGTPSGYTDQPPRVMVRVA